MRFALMLMQELTKEQFEDLINTLDSDRSQHLTEESFKNKRVIVNPEWRCPLCITTFEKESWGLQALLCDTRTDTNSTDKIFIAPLGNMSQPAQKAFGYLKLVTLMNELEGVDFKVRDVINAITTINERYAQRIIKSQSVKHVRTWSADQPNVPEYAATTTKQLFCINSQLSLRNGGEWIDVCYLPEGAFSEDPEVRKKTFLGEEDIYDLLAQIGGMIGDPKVDVDALRANSSDNGPYNLLVKGRESLHQIMADRQRRMAERQQR